MEILLIRHGDTEPTSPENFSAAKNRPDPPLNERGRRQAELLGGRLAGAGLQAVYASDLVRAQETAEAVARYTGLPVLTREALREIDMGRLHHCAWEEIKTGDPQLYKQWHSHEADLPYPGGESGADAGSRAMKVLDEIIAQGLEKIAVVTHGGIIRSLVCEALGLPQQRRFRIGPPENTSITALKYDGEKKEFSVFSLNDFSHLK